MNRRATALVAAVVLGAGCGGGGGGGTGTAPLADGGVHSSCSNEYYRQLIGTYRGTITRTSEQEDGSLLTRCEWDTEVVVRPEGSASTCALVADMTAEVTQLVVLPADDRNAFQCFGDESRRALDDPNDDLVTPAEFANAIFPVRIGVEKDPRVPGFGPYFGDESVSVFYVQLLDGTASVFDFWEVGRDDTLTFVDSSPSTIVREAAVLQKVTP